MLIAFPQQKWLRERASVLRLYVHCLCCSLMEDTDSNHATFIKHVCVCVIQHGDFKTFHAEFRTVVYYYRCYGRDKYQYGTSQNLSEPGISFICFLSFFTFNVLKAFLAIIVHKT